MAILSKSKIDGYIQVSTGAAQIQIRTNSVTIGVLHALERPLDDAVYDFEMRPGKIEFSLGSLPCWIIVLSTSVADVAYLDIS